MVPFCDCQHAGQLIVGRLQVSRLLLEAFEYVDGLLELPLQFFVSCIDFVSFLLEGLDLARRNITFEETERFYYSTC